MSADTMRSGRGRLPGMGQPTPPSPSDSLGPSDPSPRRAVLDESKARPNTTAPTRPTPARRNTSGPAQATQQPSQATPDPGPPDWTPRNGETKIQVNPRIYQRTWQHYEQLVDQLPRARRRGALTALVNAVLARHAPRDLEETRQAIEWLRELEARD